MLIFPTAEAIPFPVLEPAPHMMRVSHAGGGDQALVPVLGELSASHVSSYSLGWVFPSLDSVSSHASNAQ